MHGGWWGRDLSQFDAIFFLRPIVKRKKKWKKKKKKEKSDRKDNGGVI